MRRTLSPSLFRVFPAAIALSLAAPFAAHAQEAGRLLAIQQRKYQLTHELDLGGMFEPLDAFSKGVAVEGAYTWHFNDNLGWEVARGGYVGRVSTGLQNQLINEFGVAPTTFESLKYYVASSLVWTPLYGKLAVSNTSLLHVEVFGTLGGAFGWFSTIRAPGPELGLGFRVFLTPSTSLRFDARDAVFIHTKTQDSYTTQVLFLSLGLSISLGGSGG